MLRHEGRTIIFYTDAHFVNAFAFELELNARIAECKGSEFAHTVLNAGGDYKVFRMVINNNWNNNDWNNNNNWWNGWNNNGWY